MDIIIIQTHALMIEIVRPVEIDQVLKKVKKQKKSISESYIRKKLSADANNSDISTTSLRLSLLCPVCI